MWPSYRQRDFRVGAVSAFLLMVSSAALAQGPIERRVPEKPVRGQAAAPATTASRVVVKFREGSGVRLRVGQLEAAPAAATALRDVEGVLTSNGIAASKLRRLHARPERELDEERASAQRRSGRQLADLNLYYVVDLPPGADAAAVADRLNALPLVELAEPELKPPPPPIDLSPPTPDFSGSQGYKDPSPRGVGALDPGTVPGGDGSGISVVDVEYSWILDHEDLELPPSANIDPATLSDPFASDTRYGPNHGTAVLGEIGGRKNSYGVTGITPGARMLVAPANTVEHGYNVARAIGLATGVLDAGDAILIEQQAPVCGGSCGLDQTGCGPVEYRQSNYDAIATATALGIIVIEAAGNGSVNLDGPSCAGAFDRSIQDSGAIIVGAGDSASRSRLWYSNYGSRVDVQGWGNGITTTGGFNHMFDPGDARQRYTNDFGGTSGASPIVTGAVLALQGALKARGLVLATPTEIREALVATGTAQTFPTGHIGPLPDVRAALDRLLESRGAVAGWKPWRSVGGALGSYPECLATGVGRIDCWARSVAGTLTWNRSEGGGDSWAGWTDLGGSLKAAPGCFARGGRIDCFVTTNAGRLAQITNDGTSWGPWADRGGSVTDRPSCVPAGSGLGLDCFATGTDRALWRRQFDGTSWKAWQRIGGSTTLRPECVRRGTGIDCFVVDDSRNLRNRRLSGSTWGSWRQVGTGFGLPPQCLVSGSKMDCFAQGSGRQLLKGYYNGSTWSPWSNLGGNVGAQPYCNRLSWGFDCYWTTSTSRLVRRERRGTTWQAEADLGGAVQQRPVCLARNDGARIDCLVRGSDNTLRQRSYY